MSNMIKCDKCGKTFYTDSRSEKYSYAELTMTYWNDYSSFHLCRNCIKEALPFLVPKEDYAFLYEEHEEEVEDCDQQETGL